MKRNAPFLLLATALWLAAPLVAVGAVAFCKPGPEGTVAHFGSVAGFRDLLTLHLIDSVIPTASAAMLGSTLAASFALLVAALSRLQPLKRRRMAISLMGIPMLTSLVPRTLAILNVLAGPVRFFGETILDAGVPTLATRAGMVLDIATVAMGFGYTYCPYLFFVFWVALESVTDTQLHAGRDAGADNLALTRRLLWPTVHRLFVGIWLVTCVLMSLDIVVPDLFGNGKVLYVGPAVKLIFFRLRNRPAAVALILLAIPVAVLCGFALLGVISFTRTMGKNLGSRHGPVPRIPDSA